jgi:hypothetical protein
VTATASETEILEQLDWDKPCDLARWIHFLEVPKAEYAMHAVVPQLCGCIPPRPVVLLCRECLDIYLRGIWFRCPMCRTMLWSPRSIEQVTPL